jgi:hypothetical protein
MDGILILAVGLIAVVAVVILVYRASRKEVKQIEQHHEQEAQVHEFAPGRAHVNRKVTIHARPQHHEGTQRKLAVKAEGLPDVGELVPPKEKGIDGLIALVMNPSVEFENGGGAVEKLEPPLDLKVEYTAEDAKQTTLDASGTPRLSLILGYQDDGKWKWERLNTHVKSAGEGQGGTLHAKIHTLKPKDPVWIGHP